MSGADETPIREVTLETGVDDRIHPGRGAGIDTVINNFIDGEDTIDLSMQYPTITGFDQLRIAATEDGRGVVVDLSDHGGGLLTINGITVDRLDAGDFVFAEPDRNEIDGTSGDDVIVGKAGADDIFGREGNDTLFGQDGADALYGGAGEDVLVGNGGDDVLYGGEGADSFVFASSEGDDIIKDFEVGRDVIDLRGVSGIESFDDLSITEGSNGITIDLTAYDGGKVLVEGVSLADFGPQHVMLPNRWGGGTEEDDTLLGTHGNEIISGLGGDDRIDGGQGHDALSGDAGADTFVYSANHGNDIITDFTDGEDRIDLSALTGIAGFGDLTIVQDGHDARIDTGEGTITLYNFDAIDLDASDFVFAEAPPDAM